jgi:signal peptidase I
MKKKAIITTMICFIVLLLFTQIKIIIGLGGSMEPTYPKFKILLCIKTKNYEVDDVVYYKIDKHRVVHRIITKIDDGIITQYQTKGDGNELTDRYLITKTNIECKII